MEAYTVCVEKKSGGHTHGIHTAVCAVPIESFLDYLAHNLYTILPQRCAVLAHVKSAAHVLSLLADKTCQELSGRVSPCLQVLLRNLLAV